MLRAKNFLKITHSLTVIFLVQKIYTRMQRLQSSTRYISYEIRIILKAIVTSHTLSNNINKPSGTSWSG